MTPLIYIDDRNFPYFSFILLVNNTCNRSMFFKDFILELLITILYLGVFLDCPFPKKNHKVASISVMKSAAFFGISSDNPGLLTTWIQFHYFYEGWSLNFSRAQWCINYQFVQKFSDVLTEVSNGLTASLQSPKVGNDHIDLHTILSTQLWSSQVSMELLYWIFIRFL